jgi:hypothetical protein
VYVIIVLVRSRCISGAQALDAEGRSLNMIKAEGILENFNGPGLGLIGGVVFTLLVVASILLVRNMNMRINRLPDEFEDPTTSDAKDEG